MLISIQSTTCCHTSGDPSLLDPNGPLVSRLISTLASSGQDPSLLVDMVRQWQQALAEQLKQEQELKKKKQAPVWRCAACGRYVPPLEVTRRKSQALCMQDQFQLIFLYFFSMCLVEFQRKKTKKAMIIPNIILGNATGCT